MAAFELLPANQSGMWVSFYNPFPMFILDAASLCNSDGIKIMSSRFHPWGIRGIVATHNSIMFAGKRRISAGGGFFLLTNQVYEEKIPYISIGWKAGQNFTIGLSAHKFGIKIKDHGSAAALGWSASIQYKFNQYISWGSIFNNLTSPVIGKSKEPLPSGIISSILISADRLGFQTELRIGNHLSKGLKIGAFYKVGSFAVFSLGVSERPEILKGAIQLNLKKLHISYGGKYSIDLQRATHKVTIGINLQSVFTRNDQSTGSFRN